MAGHATIFDPDGAPEGNPRVPVNAEIALAEGQLTGALAGLVIRRQ